MKHRYHNLTEEDVRRPPIKFLNHPKVKIDQSLLSETSIPASLNCPLPVGILSPPSLGRHRLIAMRVDADKFLTELNKLFEKTKSSGSVFVTMKRSTFDHTSHISSSVEGQIL